MHAHSGSRRDPDSTHSTRKDTWYCNCQFHRAFRELGVSHTFREIVHAEHYARFAPDISRAFLGFYLQ